MTTIGHYQLGDELGKGGMGTVYRGIDTRTDNVVAVKLLRPEVTSDKTIERFRREGEALRDLNHPNIVKMLDMFEHDGQHYLVMEYVSGGNLAEHIYRDPTLNVQQIINIAIDLADALTRAHRLNIIHRDLKPANVLMGDDDVVRLTDFGVAHVGSKERMTETDAIVGTIDYLPPEVFTHGQFDERGDIWSFGVLLFEMLTGEHPFRGGAVYEIIQSISAKKLPDLETLAPSAPIPLIDLIYRMLEPDPQARISSIRHVGALLDDILHKRHNNAPILSFDTDSHQFSLLPKHNLPAQTTPFVGRDTELGELTRLLKDDSLRLITVIAPGGMGKTRLAVEAGRRLLRDFNQQVYLIPLVTLGDADGIVTVIADALKYAFQNDERSPRRQLLDYLANKHCLLILDTYEHLLDSVGLIADILQNAPDVKLLVTSRQALRQSGETVFHLSGMKYPQSITVDDASDYPAVQLFVSSAQRVQSTFTLDAQNVEHVGQICTMVQGMPLGIVLAASWLGILTPPEIVAEMKKGIHILEIDESDLPERQRSIRAVMNYTWQTMSTSEQNVFMQASVFVGGFTRDAVQAVTGAGLRTLMMLANKSILHRDTKTGRYTIHELLRQYAEEHLQQSGQMTTVREKHMQYYADYLGTYEKDFRHSGMLISAMREIEQDIENIQTAWQYATDQHNLGILDDLMSGLFHFYDVRGWIVIGEQMFKHTADAIRRITSGDQPIILGQLLCRQAKFAFYKGSHEDALRAMGESIKLLQGTSADDELAFAQSIYADTLVYMGDFETARILCENSLVIFRQNNDKWGIASALNNLGVANYYLEDYDKAIQYYDESIAISREIGDIPGVSAILSNRGAIAHEQANYAEAIQFYQESMHLSEKLHDRYGIASSQLNLGWTKYHVGDYQHAYNHTLKSIENAEQLGNRWLLTTAYINLGIIACDLNELETAQTYLAQAYTDAIQLQALHLLPDIVLGTGNFLIKSGRYDEAHALLTQGMAMSGIERETKNSIESLIRNIPIENISKIQNNSNIETILKGIFK